MTKAELAERDYVSGMKYKDIAAKYNVSLNTVKSWKSRHQWERDGATDGKVCTQRRKERSKKEKVIAAEVEQVMKNPDLTDKQRLFCLYYIRCFSAIKAYQKAYGVEYNTAATNGYKLLENAVIKAEIRRLKRNRLNMEMLDESDIFQRYMDIAFADMKDYVSFGSNTIEYTDKSGNEKEKTVPYVHLKYDKEVDGSLISEISQGREGVRIKLHDQLKALDWLTAHMGIATPEQKLKVETLKRQLGHAEEGSPDDGFLEALEDTAGGDWESADTSDIQVQEVQPETETSSQLVD